MVGATLAVALENRRPWRSPWKIAGLNLERIHFLLVDSHCHIDTARFNADREAVIQAAFEGDVTGIIDPGCDLASSEHALKLAEAEAK